MSEPAHYLIHPALRGEVEAWLRARGHIIDRLAADRDGLPTYLVSPSARGRRATEEEPIFTGAIVTDRWVMDSEGLRLTHPDGTVAVHFTTDSLPLFETIKGDCIACDHSGYQHLARPLSGVIIGETKRLVTCSQCECRTRLTA